MCERIILTDLLIKPISNISNLSNISGVDSNNSNNNTNNNTNDNDIGNNKKAKTPKTSNLNIDCSQFTQDMVVTMCVAAGCDYLVCIYIYMCDCVYG